jgi:multiple sugar transport system permease protein
VSRVVAELPVPTGSKPVGAGRPRRSRQERLAYTILVPALGTVFIIVTIPFVIAVWQSITSDDGTLIGFRNYARALGNPLFFDALRATALYALIVLPTEILLGLGFALLVHRAVKRAGLRATLYVLAVLPLVVPPVAVGVVARLIYAPGYGVLNYVLQTIGITHSEIQWLGVSALAMGAVASVDIWQWTPFVYLVLFAGLQTVPKESVEAAQVDGATWWTQFRYIELYYLRPLFLLILFFRVADVLRVFDHVYILTGGGPGTATQLLSLYIYRIEFRFFDGGQAAALAVMVLVAISVLYSLVTRALPLERA